MGAPHAALAEELPRPAPAPYASYAARRSGSERTSYASAIRLNADSAPALSSGFLSFPAPLSRQRPRPRLGREGVS